MEPETEILWRLYQEHRESARHHDEQREKITHCILLLVAAVLGLLQFTGFAGPPALLLGLFVVAAGVGGWRLTSLHSADCGGNVTCAKAYRAKLEALHPGIILQEAPPEPRTAAARPWREIHGLVVLLGLLALLMALLP